MLNIKKATNRETNKIILFKAPEIYLPLRDRNKTVIISPRILQVNLIKNPDLLCLGWSPSTKGIYSSFHQKLVFAICLQKKKRGGSKLLQYLQLALHFHNASHYCCCIQMGCSVPVQLVTFFRIHHNGRKIFVAYLDIACNLKLSWFSIHRVNVSLSHFLFPIFPSISL